MHEGMTTIRKMDLKTANNGSFKVILSLSYTDSLSALTKEVCFA